MVDAHADDEGVNTMITYRRTSARWDTYSDPHNPGWVVDVETEEGDHLTLAAAPSVYHAGPSEDPSRVVGETLDWEGVMRRDRR